MSWRRFAYTLLLSLLVPIFVLRLYLRSWRNQAHRERITERFGWVSPRDLSKPCIWLHAVSVGETLAARQLIERLLQDYPNHSLWITTTTLTGSRAVQRLFAGRVLHSYLPYDLPWLVRHFLTRVRPSVCLMIETEIWPNYYHACGAARIPVVLVNARLSERSLHGYLKVKPLLQETLAHASLIAARSAEDVVHFEQLGALSSQCMVMGNLKFDLQIAEHWRTDAQVLRQQWGAQRPVWVAASTHVGEDECVLASFVSLKQQAPDLLLILVPRHPERFQAVADLCAQTSFQVGRRSQQAAVDEKMDILLGDSMGELLLWYAAADMAFVGGSLIERGGHNPLEAAAFAIPIITGQYIYNFTDIYPRLCAAGGAVLAYTPAELEAKVWVWLQNPARREQAGQAAKQFFQENGGAIACLWRRLGIIIQ